MKEQHYGLRLSANCQIEETQRHGEWRSMCLVQGKDEMCVSHHYGSMWQERLPSEQCDPTECLWGSPWIRRGHIQMSCTHRSQVEGLQQLHKCPPQEKDLMLVHLPHSKAKNSICSFSSHFLSTWSNCGIRYSITIQWKRWSQKREEVPSLSVQASRPISCKYLDHKTFLSP